MPDNHLAALAVQIVTPYLQNHTVETARVPVIVRTVIDALAALDARAPTTAPRLATAPRPKIAGPGKKMGRPPNTETTQCQHCGRRFRDLTLHVATAHGMTMDRYREWFAAP